MAARWLHDRAPFGLLAHDTSADPFFVHANSRAWERFGCSWGEFVGMPSRLSARPDGRRDRDAFARGVRAPLRHRLPGDPCRQGRPSLLGQRT
ncbi:MEKHLA domain-containing protein [Streptomyces olivaceoviridis]|uniref:MEKHLA domain-containing protein n=1 Tax=Streptomyces olivaceoviridis TaxID=1921 RepID=UPI003697A020